VSTSPVKAPKKLIEVALPLDDINTAAAREKSIRHGHPSTLHLWWARRPLAAARAVIFAQLVNDPSWKWELEHPGEPAPGHLKGGWANARRHLFDILRELVKWESTNNEVVLEKARAEIRKSWKETCEVNKDHPRAAELFNPDKMPGLHDPFAGGGAIPLEAQRLGLEAFASDLNPVAVLINKAMIEIPPKFAGRAPVGPVVEDERLLEVEWTGAKGLAEDVRRYGAWMRAEAEKRIGHLYPQVEITKAMVKERKDLLQYEGQKLTVIAWLWARTVKSPAPAFSHVDVPLASTFVLSSKEGKQSYVEVVTKKDSYRFEVKTGKPPKEAEEGTKLGRGANFRCVLSDSAIEPEHIYGEANAGRMGMRLMALVAEGARARLYLDPTAELEELARRAKPDWKPELAMPENPRWFSPPLYGLKSYGDLFTPRQLVALTMFSDLIKEARTRVLADALAARLPDDGRSLEAGGSGATAYADAISVYLAFGVNKAVDRSSSLCVWEPAMNRMRGTFGRQALPMTWDFVETNPVGGAGGDLAGTIESLCEALDRLPSLTARLATKPEAVDADVSAVHQADAQSQKFTVNRFVSTDPPYYDNIGYADLSDFFYVWLRRSLREVLPVLFSTRAVPKAEELIASSYRHGGRRAAEDFFLNGMIAAIGQLASSAHCAAPVTIYYAFKQSETRSSEGTASSGWETFLEAVISSGFAIVGTWPMRTELETRSIGRGTNSLASSIVLVCRPRAASAPSVSRREFIRELNRVLPLALDEMTKGVGEERSPVAPVDLSQAIIGPGMAVFSKYASVLEADGKPMSVKSALQLINRFLAESDFDADTQFCLAWFEQNRWEPGPYGDADVLARAKATSVSGAEEAGVVSSKGGKVRLLKPAEYPAEWDPRADKRLPVWEALHQLIFNLKNHGETGAARVLAAVTDRSESIRQLAYRLYTLCERQRLAEDARAYNELITSWTAIETAAASAPVDKPAAQLKLI
jgi:putative DNA methylase